MKRKHGFTLIELLTVVMIIAVLTAIAVPQYRKAIQRAEAATALINLRAVFDAAKRYYAQTGTWPDRLSRLDTKLLVNSGTTDVADGFRYEFNTTYLGTAATRLSEDGTSLYTLHAFYKLPIGSTNPAHRDVFTCQWRQTKYKYLCESFGDETTGYGIRIE